MAYSNAYANPPPVLDGARPDLNRTDRPYGLAIKDALPEK
jgi:hypothetical protein